MQNDLATLIKSTATRERARDFAWNIAISAGIALATIVFISFISPIAPLWLPILSFTSFLAALTIRYRFSSGRNWVAPVQRVVQTELNANLAELSKLRLVRGVAQALPEPLFIL